MGLLFVGFTLLIFQENSKVYKSVEVIIRKRCGTILLRKSKLCSFCLQVLSIRPKRKGRAWPEYEEGSSDVGSVNISIEANSSRD
jgi:hypothetical protein